ncbi:ester cyclase [Natronorarus salvus]|uniref:ester cyclase n=1 Tax=Natronorarus salvus TaxID=3117733 RepID=UPI002F265512
MAEQTARDGEEVARAAMDVHSGDVSKLDVYAETVSRYDPFLPDEGAHGRDAFENDVRDVKTAFPDVRVTADDMLVSDDVVMIEWTWTGTHEGEFAGIPPTQNTVEVRGMMKLVIEDGQIQEERSYYDAQDHLTQLGVSDE